MRRELRKQGCSRGRLEQALASAWFSGAVGGCSRKAVDPEKRSRGGRGFTLSIPVSRQEESRVGDTEGPRSRPQSRVERERNPGGFPFDIRGGVLALAPQWAVLGLGSLYQYYAIN